MGDIFCRYVLHNVLKADTKTIFKKESVFICNVPLGEIGDTSSYEYLQGTEWLTCCGGDGKKPVFLLPGDDRDKTEVGKAEKEEEAINSFSVRLGEKLSILMAFEKPRCVHLEDEGGQGA